MPRRGINRRIDFTVNENLRRRFWKRVKKGEPNECWEWQGAMRNGYGAIRHEGRTLSSHRVAYALTYGKPEDELVIGHKCDNRACCNPGHLEAITQSKNVIDALERRDFFHNRGEDAPQSVITEDDVRDIMDERSETGHGSRRIAKSLGLPEPVVNQVIRGNNWTHVTGGRL